MLAIYGIFAAKLGKRTDFPVQLLDDAVTPLSMNVRTVDGEIHRARGRVAICPDPVAWNNKTAYDEGDAVIHGGVIYVADVGTTGNEPPHADWTAVTVPDSTAPILHYHRLVLRSGLSYLYAFTKNAIYVWNETQSYWQNWVGETDAVEAIVIDPTTTEWSTATYHDMIIATNGKQALLYGGPGKVAVLGTSPFTYVGDNSSIATHGLDLDGDGDGTKVIAKFVLTYEDYVLIGNLSEGGTAANNRMRHCGIGDIMDWDQTGAAAGAIDIPNQTGLTGGKVSGDRVILFGDSAYGQLWLTADEYLRFEYAEISSEYGCMAPGSIVARVDGSILFLASDMRLREAASGRDISEGIDDVLRRIPLEYVSLVRAQRIPEYDEIWWSIPYGLVEANNRVITLTADGVWNELSWDIACFGAYSTQTAWTLETLPYATLTEWAEEWVTIGDMAGASGFLYDIGADDTGATYRLHATTTDKGEDFSGAFSLETDLYEGFALNVFKRLLRVRLYMQRDPGTTINVAVARDSELYWRDIGAHTMVVPSVFDTALMVILDYPCDGRAQHFGIRVESSNGDFRFVGMLFEYVPDGAR